MRTRRHPLPQPAKAYPLRLIVNRDQRVLVDHFRARMMTEKGLDRLPTMLDAVCEIFDKGLQDVGIQSPQKEKVTL